jgi:molybdate transport system permease protein
MTDRAERTSQRSPQPSTEPLTRFSLRQRAGMSLRTPRALTWVSSSILVAFVLVPLVAVVARAPLGAEFIDTLSSDIVRQALLLSLTTTAFSLTITVIAGTPVAYLLARHRFRGHALIDTIIDLPMVLPPAVAGVALLMAFGRRGLLGPTLSSVFGLELPFTTAAVVLAQIFVSAPFYVKSAKSGLEAVDQNLEQVAATLGASRLEVFRSVTVPLALPALLGGMVMAWARALGEFGATIMFAGNFSGRTQTMPLAIFQAMESGDLDATLTLSIILIVVSFSVLLIFKGLTSYASRTGA